MNNVLDALYEQLEDSGISRSSPRAHTAAANVTVIGLEAAVRIAQRDESAAREVWRKQVLDPFCRKHGITRTQAISLAFDDGSYDRNNPENSLVTMQDLYWGGQGNDFANQIKAAGNAIALDSPVGPPYFRDEFMGATEGPQSEYAEPRFVCCEAGLHFVSEFVDGNLRQRCSWQTWETNEEAATALAKGGYNSLQHF